MNIASTPLEGVMVVETVRHLDQRGLFFRAYCQNELARIIGMRQIAQINVSRTYAVGSVRGMHYQYPPCTEMKLIRCLKGKVWDVAVDLRAGSSTFRQWHAEELSAENGRMMVVPEGCAHGFQVLEPDSELLYLHTAFYAPEYEGGVLHDDPRLSIAWPLPAADVSVRDRSHPAISTEWTGIIL